MNTNTAGVHKLMRAEASDTLDNLIFDASNLQETLCAEGELADLPSSKSTLKKIGDRCEHLLKVIDVITATAKLDEAV